MNFKQAKKLGLYISKDYAEEIFRLLANYQNISASEAASRLSMHIKTAQDFLEAMADLSILSKEEVYEGKRPYNRYSLKAKKILMEIDINSLDSNETNNDNRELEIRERKNAGARFTVARDNLSISSVVIWIGRGRDKKERKINLTLPQGKFLYNLPFPTAEFMSASAIMTKAGIENKNKKEILDIINVLKEYKVIEEED
ncbi:hypothetical protein ACFLSQ_02350 [Bacteroidota bacterium]